MHIHCLQHVDFEHAAAIGDWAVARGHTLSSGGFYAGDSPPAPQELDWLVLMGGPMSTYDEQLLPWLREEKRYLQAVLQAGARMLGICLGAQLLAELLGATVGRNPFKEIGWLPVRLSMEALEHPFFRDVPKEFTAFHWHGDTFSLPQNAVPLGSSEGCATQGFLWRQRVLGLQFHLESTPESVEALIENCQEDITPGPYVQQPHVMRQGLEHVASMRPVLEILLQRLEGAATGG